MKSVLRLDLADNVAVTSEALFPGEEVSCGQSRITVNQEIPPGHKIALVNIGEGENIVKYSSPIGHALSDIISGSWVHTHNLKTNLSGELDYRYEPAARRVELPSVDMPELRMFKRKNGRMGIRNELWVIPTVGCVNSTGNLIVREFQERGAHDGVDGVYCFTHPYGCSQLGDDHERTKRLLQNMAVHPNAGGVLILGLGCENNQIEQFRASMPEGWDEERIIFAEAQLMDDEVEESVDLLEMLYRKASLDVRTRADISDLVIGLECGGSDAFSGITANPLLGRFSDFITGAGGSSMLTEVPEMFGAEHLLMEQCESREIFEQTVNMINGFKRYYQSHNQPIYENPSPGNKKGGISTLEEKSLGCTRKAGSSRVVDVLEMDQRMARKGLNLLSAPGNDAVATTVLGTAGCQLVLFTTGRGNPLGGFIPTMKISTNTALAEKKPHWIDFDAGRIFSGSESEDEVLEAFIMKVAAVINGEEVAAETKAMHDIALFKTGVTL